MHRGSEEEQEEEKEEEWEGAGTLSKPMTLRWATAIGTTGAIVPQG